MSLAAEGLLRRLVHAVPAQGLFPAEPQHWEWQALGRWRATEAQARADLVLLDTEVLEALRIVLFLATESTGGDPDPDEAAALLTVMALIDLMEVADG